MRWQRARLLAHDGVTANQPPKGFCFWVRAERPRDFEAAAFDPRFPAIDHKPRYATNLVGGGYALAVSPEMVELLAEFSEEDPPRIAWGAWERDGRAVGEGE